ncbi:UvrABC system protein B [Streptomyces glaucescens]
MHTTVHGFGYGLVTPLAAYLMAFLGGALGLRCTARAMLVTRSWRPGWLALGSAAIGSGIWTMHFVAMMGFTIEHTPIRYDWLMTFASLAVAVVMVGVGIFIVGYRGASGTALFTGGTITGLGIASMHYLGMAGMSLDGQLTYNTLTVAVSVAIAMAAATAALWAAGAGRGFLWSLGAALDHGTRRRRHALHRNGRPRTSHVQRHRRPRHRRLRGRRLLGPHARRPPRPPPPRRRRGVLDPLMVMGGPPRPPPSTSPASPPTPRPARSVTRHTAPRPRQPAPSTTRSRTPAKDPLIRTRCQCGAGTADRMRPVSHDRTTAAPFEVVSSYQPNGDQPAAIADLARRVEAGEKDVVLLGATGTGKSATTAWMIEELQRPTLAMAPNKTLAAQLANEFRELLPHNAVEYFVSYYDYYQPEAYVPQSDTYIEKDSSINEEVERLRHSATNSPLTRRDVVVVASVSCIYGLGTPQEYVDRMVPLRVGDEHRPGPAAAPLRRHPVHAQRHGLHPRHLPGPRRHHRDLPGLRGAAVRIEMFGDEIEALSTLHPLTGEIISDDQQLYVFPASHDVRRRAPGARGQRHREGTRPSA